MSTFSLAILGLISQKPRSGYDLRKVFSTTPMGHFSSSPGAIYPALKRIQEQGWITGSIENKQTLRPRQVYRLTKKGEKALREYLSQPVTHEDVVWHLDSLMLRFAFMGEILGREETLRFLHDFLSEVESYVSALKQHLKATREYMPPHGRFAMENGIEGYEVHARWARRVIKELKGRKASQRRE